ncbi:Intersectin 1 (SH3 domain protein) [Chytriomyces hyalinus]|nr:Intersectin 1 (SH3 domain protein) [Chytriomyces hyalinus]
MYNNNQYGYQQSSQGFQSQGYPQQNQPPPQMGGFASQMAPMNMNMGANPQQQNMGFMPGVPMNPRSGFAGANDGLVSQSGMGLAQFQQQQPQQQQSAYGVRSGFSSVSGGSVGMGSTGGMGPMDLRRSVSAAPVAIGAGLGNVKLDFIPRNELDSFEATFLSATGGAHQITAMAARNVFVQSGLSDEILARIWDLSSVLKNPTLTFPEFALAMFLIKHRLSNGGDIPAVLPPAVRAAVIAATNPQSMPSVMPLPSSNMARSASGIGFENSAPSRAASTIQNRTPVSLMSAQQSSFESGRGSNSGLNSGNTSSTWAITQQEKAQHDTVFKTWDPSNSGYISGDRAIQIFKQSGLSDDILGHIWSLADTQNSGKLDSNEFAVAMHLIYAKRGGKDLPKTLPANLVPPSTRELDSITSLMKTQVISDMKNKRPAYRAGGSSFMADDPLAAGFSPQGSRSSLTHRAATKEEREEERKIRAAELELKKKELAIVNNRLEAAQSAHREMSSDVAKAKRDAINAHEDLTFSLDSRETLIDQVRSLIPDSTRGGGSVGGVGGASVAGSESQVAQLEREIQALLADCKDLSASKADRQIQNLREQDRLRGGSGVSPAQTAAEKANAILAARMAALGVNAPQLNIPASSANSVQAAPSILTADIRRVEDARVATDRELEDAAIRVRSLVSSFRTIAQAVAGQGSGAGASGAKGFSAAAVLSSLKSWEPPIESKIKYEEGVGLRSEEVRNVVLEMKKKTSSKGSYAANAVASTSASRNASTKPFDRQSSQPYSDSKPSFNNSGNNNDVSPAPSSEERRKSNNPFGEFTSSAGAAPYSAAPPPPPVKPSEVSAPALQPFVGHHEPRVSVPSAPIPVSQPSAAASASTNAVNDVVAQAQAAIRAAKERAAARTAGPAIGRSSVTVSPSQSVSSLPAESHSAASPIPSSANTAPPQTLNTPFGPVSPGPFSSGVTKPTTFATKPSPPVPSPLIAKTAPPPPPALSAQRLPPSVPAPRGAAPPPPPARGAPPPPPAARAPAPHVPPARAAVNLSVAPPVSAAADITSQAEDLTRAAKAARNSLTGMLVSPKDSVEPSAKLPEIPSAGKSVKDFKNFNPFGGGFEKTTVAATSDASTVASPTVSKPALDLPPPVDRGMSVKDFKNFNPFGGGFGKSASEIAAEATPVAPMAATDGVLVPTGGPPPPPPPPPALLPSIAAAAAAAPTPPPTIPSLASNSSSGGVPPPPPPPPPAPTMVSPPQKQRSMSPAPVARTSTQSPQPAPAVAHTSLLKSALLKVRGAHASDDDDDSDDNDDDNDDWGPPTTARSASIPVPKPIVAALPPVAANPYIPSFGTPFPPIPAATSPTSGMSSPVDVNAPTISPSNPFSMAPPPSVFQPISAAPPPIKSPEPISASFTPFSAPPPMDTLPLSGAPPPPPPPPPPPGIAPPVVKFERGTSLAEVPEATPARKPDPKAVGAVGLNLFAEAAAKAKARAEKAEKAHSTTNEEPVSAAVVDFFTPAAPVPSSDHVITSNQRAKPPPPPPSKTPSSKDHYQISPTKGIGGDDWELLSKSDIAAFDTVSSQPNPENHFGQAGQRTSLSSNPFGVFKMSTENASTSPKAANDWMTDFGVKTDATAYGNGAVDIFGKFASMMKEVASKTEIKNLQAPTSPMKTSFDDAFSVPTLPTVLFKAKCLFDFTPGRPDDLALSASEILNVEREDGDWLFGTKVSDSSQQGWFPRNYVEEYNENKVFPEFVEAPAVEKSSDPIGAATALYDYTANREDELSLSVGEVLTIFEKTDNDWWDVMNDAGSRGMVPSSYVKEQSLDEPAEFSPTSMENEYSLRVSSEGFQHWVSVVDPQLLAQMTIEDRKRQEAIFEIIQTECHYLRDLQLIVEVFYQPMAEYLHESELRTIFCNVEEILMANTVIFSDFESAQQQQRYVVNNIGELFLRHARSLDCYEIYCGNQGVASRMLQKKRQEIPSLQQFLKTCQSNPRCRSLDLSSFLLIPMQRITRYIIMLKQVLHYTPPNHPEHSSVSRAVEMADRVAERVNIAVMAVESRDKLEAINSQVDFYGSDFVPVDVMGPSNYGGPRGYLFESHLAKSKSGKKLYGFILSDMILIVQPQSAMNIFKDRSFAYTLYHAPIPIHSSTVRDVPRAMLGNRDVGAVDDTTFQIVQGDEVLTLKAPSASIKNKWFTYHESAMRALK